MFQYYSVKVNDNPSQCISYVPSYCIIVNLTYHLCYVIYLLYFSIYTLYVLIDSLILYSQLIHPFHWVTPYLVIKTYVQQLVFHPEITVVRHGIQYFEKLAHLCGMRQDIPRYPIPSDRRPIYYQTDPFVCYCFNLTYCLVACFK